MGKHWPMLPHGWQLIPTVKGGPSIAGRRWCRRRAYHWFRSWAVPGCSKICRCARGNAADSWRFVAACGRLTDRLCPAGLRSLKRGEL